MGESLAQFAAKVKSLEDDMDGGAWLRSVSRKVGEEAKGIAEREASADLGGDPKFSGWAPTLDTKFMVRDDGRTMVFSPTRSSAGPWTVATVGRNQGNASGFAGPAMTRSGGVVGRTKSGGVRRTRARAGKRWNGRTQGKGTGDQVAVRVEKVAPDLIDAEMGKRLRKTFR